MSIKEKERGMRDFVLKMHDAYQKKEGEIHKALDFKTKCIIKFVDMMKKWLDNWTLKQEYLVSLRE
jgi:L-amino acid N-acyltransferase YncA